MHQSAESSSTGSSSSESESELNKPNTAPVKRFLGRNSGSLSDSSDDLFVEPPSSETVEVSRDDFDVKLTNEEWKQIKPVESAQADRSGRVSFRGRYADIFASYIQKQNPYCILKSCGMTARVTPSRKQNTPWAYGHFDCTMKGCSFGYALTMQRDQKEKVTTSRMLNLRVQIS